MFLNISKTFKAILRGMPLVINLITIGSFDPSLRKVGNDKENLNFSFSLSVKIPSKISDSNLIYLNNE